MAQGISSGRETREGGEIKGKNDWGTEQVHEA